MTRCPTLPASAYHRLHDSLSGLYDLNVDHIAEAELSDLAVAACLAVPAAERAWHGHQLRRQLTEAYRGAGFMLVEGCYDVRALLDVIGALVAHREKGEA